MRPVSLVWLGWYFVQRLLVRAVTRRRGLSRFLASYGPEGLAPLATEEKAVVAALSRCIACGACDARFDAYERVARTSLRAPSDLVLSASRSLPEWSALVGPLAELEKGDLRALEAVCPARIPFRDVVRVAKKRALAAQESEGLPARVATLQKLPAQHDPG